ncbi:MAG: AI-2E family transporter, partial [Proteobacteria bacterium]
MQNTGLPSDPSQSPSRFLILPVWILAIYALGLLMSETATLFLWVVCAFFLFVLLDNSAERLKKKGWPTVVSAIFLVLVATLLTVVVVYALGALFSDMVFELDQSKKLFLQAFDSLNVTWTQWWAKLPGLHSTGGAPSPGVSKVEVVQGSPFG